MAVVTEFTRPRGDWFPPGQQPSREMSETMTTNNKLTLEKIRTPDTQWLLLSTDLIWAAEEILDAIDGRPVTRESIADACDLYPMHSAITPKVIAQLRKMQ